MSIAAYRLRPGDMVLVRESDSTIHRNGLGGKLQHDRWTGLWKVTKVLQKSLIFDVEMDGRNLRTR